MNFLTTILPLDYDTLNAILVLVFTSAGGATHLARMMAVCKLFYMLGDNKEILKMASFEKFDLPESLEHWLHIKGLVIRCAEAGNTGAQYILAKVILLGYSRVLDQESNYNKLLLTNSHTDQASAGWDVGRDALPSFLLYFTPGLSMDHDSNRRKLTHFELVSLFLRRCSISDHVSMLPYVRNYVEHFGSKNKRCMRFFDCFHTMTDLVQLLVDEGKERRTWYSPRLLINDQTETEMRNPWAVLGSLQIKFNHYFVNRNRVLSQPKWIELKRECRFIDELLSSGSCSNPLDQNYKILDLGKRVFYYLAFSGPISREIDLPLDEGMSNLQAESIAIVEIYTAWQEKTVSAFDDMFLPQRRV